MTMRSQPSSASCSTMSLTRGIGADIDFAGQAEYRVAKSVWDKCVRTPKRFPAIRFLRARSWTTWEMNAPVQSVIGELIRHSLRCIQKKVVCRETISGQADEHERRGLFALKNLHDREKFKRFWCMKFRVSPERTASCIASWRPWRSVRFPCIGMRKQSKPFWIMAKGIQRLESCWRFSQR